MMDKKAKVKNLFIILIIFALLIGLYFLLKYLKRNNTNWHEDYLKNYDVNEYIPTYVSDENMAEIYLKDYINNIIYDVESSYNLLDEEYRATKFKDYASYYNYIKNLDIYNIKMEFFYKKKIDKHIIFIVYDQYDNFYAFKTNGVMQYSVFLDADTVEIW